MIKTLGVFLTRELAKVTGLALVAFTLVMTIFAIIEPLRKEGLAAGQLAALLAYTVPITLSLTLPVAALFASTIVYGRFSQDNELTACRASGLSTVRVLKPAMALGAVVTLLSLLLSNYITPKMMQLTELSAKANVLGIVRQRFRTQGYVDYDRGQQIVHADSVEQDHETLDLRGVVAVDGRKKDDVRILTASNAVVQFDQNDGRTFVTVSLIRPTVMRTSSRDIIEQASMPLPPRLLSDRVREDASWYEWDRLLGTLKEPAANSEIASLLTKIQRRLANDALAREIAAEVNAARAYEGLTLEGETYAIRAATAEVTDKETVALRSQARDGQVTRPVELTIKRDGRTRQVIRAESGSIEVNWALGQDAPTATVSLKDGVTVSGGAGGGLQRRTDWESPPLAVPKEVLDRAAGIPLADICLRGNEMTSSAGIRRDINELNLSQIPRLTKRIKGELHGRIAYGISCFLMVAMGAALGLMFRGGQIISAFALAAIPAAIVIIMMLMGKQLVRRIDLPTIYGLSAVWGGIVALLIADLCVYLHLSRK